MDLSWLRGRANETSPPWDYGERVRAAARDARRTLDVDTGGGELLARLTPFAGTVVATEGHGPNVEVAANRLAPLGIPVVQAESAPDNVDQAEEDPSASPLPFTSGVFDLVLDRHSSYWPSEVLRVLVGGGRFLTQQRGESGSSGEAWEALFGRPDHPHRAFDLPFAQEQPRAAGFKVVEAREADMPMAFFDLAAVVYYLRLVPWAVEGFDPDRDRGVLRSIHRRIDADGKLMISGSHMLLDAVKPA